MAAPATCSGPTAKTWSFKTHSREKRSPVASPGTFFLIAPYRAVRQPQARQSTCQGDAASVRRQIRQRLRRGSRLEAEKFPVQHQTSPQSGDSCQAGNSELAEMERFELSRAVTRLPHFESLEAGVFWSILSASLRLSERRKPLILLGFPAFSLSAQGFGDFSCQSRFYGKV